MILNECYPLSSFWVPYSATFPSGLVWHFSASKLPMWFFLLWEPVGDGVGLRSVFFFPLLTVSVGRRWVCFHGGLSEDAVGGESGGFLTREHLCSFATATQWSATKHPVDLLWQQKQQNQPKGEPMADWPVDLEPTHHCRPADCSVSRSARFSVTFAISSRFCRDVPANSPFLWASFIFSDEFSLHLTSEKLALSSTLLHTLCHCSCTHRILFLSFFFIYYYYYYYYLSSTLWPDLSAHFKWNALLCKSDHAFTQ